MHGNSVTNILETTLKWWAMEETWGPRR